MAWYESVWQMRQLISVVNTAGAAAGDVDVVIPRELDIFWNAIDAAGDELRAVSYDCRTKLAYSVDNGSGGAFNKASRLGRVRIDNVTLPAVANSVTALWLYFNSTTAQGSGTGVAGAGGLTGHLETSRPSDLRSAYEAQLPGSTRPRSTFHKRVNEEKYAWVNFKDVLATRPTPGNGTIYHESPYYLTCDVLDTAGASVPTMLDATRNRLVWWNRELWAKILVQAGTTGNHYTLLPDFRTVIPGGTTVNARHIPTIGVDVRDIRHLT